MLLFKNGLLLINLYHWDGVWDSFLKKQKPIENILTGKPKSELTKSKISIKHNSDKWFNNGIDEIHTKECPERYIPGRLPITEQSRKNRSEAQKGLRWFTDGSMSKQFRSLEEVPIGWKPGRVIVPSTTPRKPSSVLWFWITDGENDKQHPIHNPIPEGYKKGKCKIYTGPKKRKEDLTIYNLYHPRHGNISGNRKHFEERWGISKGKFNRIKRSKLTHPHGWRFII